MAPDSAAALRQLPQQQSARGGNTRCGDNPLTIGPFAKAWPELQPLGLALIPLGGIDGKVTIPSWRKWTSPPGPKALRRFASQFPASNIGALPGLSRPPLTVVDADDDDATSIMLRRCGDTPLITATPGGGHHLWYRNAGEKTGHHLRRLEGLNVDVKAAGGVVVIPPSRAWLGDKPGKPYVLLKGTWADLASLPEVLPGSLPIVERPAEVITLRAVRHGLRNSALQKGLLREVKHCDDFETLLDVARTIVAEDFELVGVPPFDDAEIVKTARSVWQMEIEGRNWVGKEAQIIITSSELVILERNPDGLVLWMKLRWKHGASRAPFAIACKAMAEAEEIAGWTDPRRYQRARDWLLSKSFLKLLHAGGSQPGDCSLYRLASPPKAASAKGAENAPNIREHPSPHGRAL
jgi:hypothetical protein